MAQAGVLSFIGVGLLYVAGFGCVRHPAMALACLLVPMGWAFGYIVLTVGHLNILSSAFATIVIGLGSDYGVYHIAQYLRFRGEKMSTFEALMETARSVGPGLTTSAVATALAFFTIGLSDFPGIAELGIIAGGGILLCWLASLTTLPALLHWSDAHRGPWQAPAPLDVYAWLRPLVNRPKLVVAGYVAFTVFVCFGLKDLWYDHNLLNLQAQGLESVELEKSLLQSDCGASFATVMAKSREEVVARKAMYVDRELCPMVDSVDEIATYVPADVAEAAADRADSRSPGGHLPDSQLCRNRPQFPWCRAGSSWTTHAWLEKLQGAMLAMQRAATRPASCSRFAASSRTLPRAGILPPHVGLPESPGGRHAAMPLRLAQRVESRTAALERLARGRRGPARRQERLLLHADPHQGRHLEHGRNGAVRRPVTGCRRAAARR